MYNDGGGAVLGGGGAAGAGSLAYTGFSVMTFAVVACALILFGVILLRSKTVRLDHVPSGTAHSDPMVALAAAVESATEVER